MAGKTSLKDFEPFFGGDQKGAFLVQAMFNGTNYTDRTGFNSGLMTELLRAENYKNFASTRSPVNGQSQGNDDVHQDVTDLIITTALFHRTIDKSSTAGTNLGDAINRITSSLTNYLDYKPNAPIAMFNSVANNADADPGTGNAQPREIHDAYGDVLNNGPSIFLYLIYGLADRAIWDAQTHLLPGTLNHEADVHGETHNSIADMIIANDNRDNIEADHQLDLCWGALMYKEPNANSSLMALENAIGGVAANVRDLIVRNIKSGLKKSIIKIIVKMKDDIKTRYPNIHAEEPRRNQYGVNNQVIGQRNIATVMDFLNPQTITHYKNYIKNLFWKNIRDEITVAVNTVVDIPHTTLIDADAKTFFNKVYSAWPTMSTDIRQFYGQNISVFAKTGSPLVDPNNDIYRKQALTMDWIRLTPAEVDSLFRQGRILSQEELGNLRVNLMKSVLGGNKEVLFGSNLPDVPNGSNVWYTHDNGTYGYVKSPPDDFLRRLYMAVYSIDVIANPLNINVVYENPALNIQLTNIESVVANRPKTGFNLNIGKFTVAAIKREDEQIENQTQQHSTPVIKGMDAYSFLTAYDMVYDKLWTYDNQKGQYYRIEGNRRVYYDDIAKGDTKTCYATYLGKSNDSGCLRVIQCIADGNSKSLNRCLDVIGDVDLWEVAEDDVQKVGPDMVKLVLRKFGVKGYEETDSNGVKYKIPFSYEEWEKTVVANFPDEVKKTIMSNNKLKTYIKGLIEVCRANPNILNKNNPVIVARDDTPVYINNLNIKKYKIPSIIPKIQYEFFAEQLRNAVHPTYMDSGIFNSITNGNFSNIMFVNPYTTPIPTMLGGNLYAANTPSLVSASIKNDSVDRQAQILKNGSSTMFSSLLITIDNALVDVGLRLHNEDKARLLSVIDKLETYESQLAKMCSVLINIVKIARFYGISLENVDRDHVRVMKLSDLHTIDDIRDFVRGYAKEITKNMVTNMSIQQTVAHELMTKAGPRLIDNLTGNTNSSGSSIGSKQLVDI